MMVARAVDFCESVFDTGSDHAFVPIYLIQNGICKSAVASDVREGPLKVSIRNIKKYDLTDSITIKKGDGIENAAGFDCIIIAGMGGQLISDLIEKNKDIAKNTKQLVLQPMNAPEKLRKYLWDEGFSIVDENLCSEKHRVYNVMCAEYTGKAEEYYEWQLHSSKQLLKNKNSLLPGYLAPKLKRLHAMQKGLGYKDENFNELIAKLEEIIDEYS